MRYSQKVKATVFDIVICRFESFCLRKNLCKMNIDIIKYLTIPTVLFLIGMWGIFINRKNVLIMLMSIELMLLAINLNFIIFSVYLDDILGQIFALFILTIAAAESSIGLAILVVYYRIRGNISVELRYNLLG